MSEQVNTKLVNVLKIVCNFRRQPWKIMDVEVVNVEEVVHFRWWTLLR